MLDRSVEPGKLLKLDPEGLRLFNIEWKGTAEIISTEEDRLDRSDCRGMCRDQVLIYLLKLLALDGDKLKETGFYDIRDEIEYIDVPIIGGRGIIISPDIPKPLLTDSCIVVCCRKLALHIMKYRYDH